MLPFISFGIVSITSIVVGKRLSNARKKRKAGSPQPKKDGLHVQILAHRVIEKKKLLLATEDLPMDNRFGNKLLSSEHEFSQTASISLTLGNNRRIAAAHKSTLWRVLESKTEGEIGKSLGIEVGSQVSRRVRLKFATDPGQFVRYRVVWQQESQRGIFDVQAGKHKLQLPYMVAYGLTHTVESLPR